VDHLLGPLDLVERGSRVPPGLDATTGIVAQGSNVGFRPVETSGHDLPTKVGLEGVQYRIQIYTSSQVGVPTRAIFDVVPASCRGVEPKEPSTWPP